MARVGIYDGFGSIGINGDMLRIAWHDDFHYYVDDMLTTMRKNVLEWYCRTHLEGVTDQVGCGDAWYFYFFAS